MTETENYLKQLKQRTMEHAWATYENIDATRVLKQHCYVNKQCGKFWETPYQGAKALCGAGGVSEDGDTFLPVSELFAEEIKSDCCKRCLKILESKIK